MMKSQDREYNPEEIIFFDLEHYVYKKPKCIGVFGACEYDNKNNHILVTQYMIEDRDEAINILYLAKEYFIRMKEKGKKTIVTFSGNNDFTVINYLFKENGIDYNFGEEFDSIDIQKEYEKEKKVSTGLKKLEKILLYNEQDVINLLYIYINWKKYIFEEAIEDIIEDEIAMKNIDDSEDYNMNEDELNTDL